MHVLVKGAWTYVHTALHILFSSCNTLCCTALHCSTLYCTVLHCTTTHRTVTHCTSLLHTVINHITLRCPLQHAALHHTATHITARNSFISLHNITPSSQSISRSQGSLSIFSSMPFLPCSVHQKYREVRTFALLILSYVTVRNSTHVSMHEHAVQTLKHFHFVTRKHHSTSFINSHFSFSTVSCVKTFKWYYLFFELMSPPKNIHRMFYPV